MRGRDETAPPKAIDQCYRRHWGEPLHTLVEANDAWLVLVGTDVSKYLAGNWAGERAAGSLIEVELPTIE